MNKDYLTFIFNSMLTIILLILGLAIFASLSPDKENYDFGYCSTTGPIVKKYVAKDWGGNYKVFRNAGECTVLGTGQVRIVKYAYSTPITRRNNTPPIQYTARVAHNSQRDTYWLCMLDLGDGDVTHFKNQPLC